MKYIRKLRYYALCGILIAIFFTVASIMVLLFEKDLNVEALITVITSYVIVMITSILCMLTALWYVGFDDNNKVHFRNMFGVKKEFYLEELTLKNRQFKNGRYRFYIYKGNKRIASISTFDPGFQLLNKLTKDKEDNN